MASSTNSQTTLSIVRRTVPLSIYGTHTNSRLIRETLSRCNVEVPQFMLPSQHDNDCDTGNMTNPNLLKIPSLGELLKFAKVALNRDCLKITWEGFSCPIRVKLQNDEYILYSEQDRIGANNVIDIIDFIRKAKSLPPSGWQMQNYLQHIELGTKTLQEWLKVMMRFSIARRLYQLDGVHSVTDQENELGFLVEVDIGRRDSFEKSYPEIVSDPALAIVYTTPVECENQSGV